jgi:hypothetical protein
MAQYPRVIWEGEGGGRRLRLIQQESIDPLDITGLAREPFLLERGIKDGLGEIGWTPATVDDLDYFEGRAMARWLGSLVMQASARAVPKVG